MSMNDHLKAIDYTPQMFHEAEEGRKTQTRRVIIPQPLPLINKILIHHEKLHTYMDKPHGRHHIFEKPDGQKLRYQVGDLVAARTTWATLAEFDHLKPSQLDPDAVADQMWFDDTQTPLPSWAGKKRPGRFLPRSLWHLCPLYKIKKITAHKIQEITAQSIFAEGVGFEAEGGWWPYEVDTSFKVWAELWDSINAKRGYSYDQNPWVIAYEFSKLSDRPVYNRAGAASFVFYVR